MDPGPNPFAVLSLIVAPAIMTNASSVLAMSTSNRLARAVDRARQLSKELEDASDLSTPEAVRRLRDLTAAEDRAALLLRALRSIYAGLGGFASAALLSLLGAISVSLTTSVVATVLEIGAAVAGVVAIAALLHGSAVLVRETRIAVQVLQVRAAELRRRAQRPAGG